MSDAAKEATGRATQGRGRPTLSRRALTAAGIAIAVSASAWLLFALTQSGAGSADQSQQSALAAVDPAVLQERRYTDGELGLYRIIEGHLEPVWAQFRSLNEWNEYRAERNSYWREKTGHERERMHFERNVESVLLSEYDQLPADLGRGGVLDRAFEKAMDRCAQSEGWPSVQLYGVSNADVEQYEAAFGLSLEGFLDLRHECAKQAAAYPTLDPAVRDELLGRLKEHYRVAVHEYLREFPDAEVPLVEHEDSPRPLEDRFISICRKEPEPAVCAAEYRVELPAE